MTDASAQLVEQLAAGLALSRMSLKLRLAVYPTGYSSLLLVLGENTQVWIYDLSAS